jgi:hypothetical protein
MATRTAPKLSQGWRVEMLGMINGVEFTGPNSGLTWCDGRWHMTARGLSTPAPGVPKASTQAEARKIGSAFIAECFGEDA